MLRKILSVLCGLVALMSSGFLVVVIRDLRAGGHGEITTGTLVIILVFLIGVAAWSVFLARRLWSPRGRRPFDAGAYEEPLLELALQHEGRLTVPEAAAELRLPADLARKALDHLVITGIADTMVSDSGALVFSIPGLVPGGKKKGRTRRDVSELPAQGSRPPTPNGLDEEEKPNESEEG